MATESLPSPHRIRGGRGDDSAIESEPSASAPELWGADRSTATCGTMATKFVIVSQRLSLWGADRNTATSGAMATESLPLSYRSMKDTVMTQP